MNRIEFNTPIKAPVERCFDMARSIDFHKISLGPLKEEAVAGFTSGLINQHEHVLMKSKLWGFQFSTELKITKFNPPFFLSYDIADSNFESIIHDYYFYDISNETVMVNHFYYKPKLGILGELLNVLFLRRYLTHILKTRNELLREYAESNQWRTILPIPEWKYQSFAKK